MVFSSSKDSSLSVNNLLSEIKSASDVEEHEMSGVRFVPDSHDPSRDVCEEKGRCENEMGKVFKPKESKSLSDKEIARIKRNKRISRRKDVCKSMPIFLEHDSAEKLEDRIKAIVLDTSATKSRDDSSLFQPLPILDDVIEKRISRGSNITDSEKIYHKLCRRTKSFILSPDGASQIQTVDFDKKEFPMTWKESPGIYILHSRRDSERTSTHRGRTSSASRDKQTLLSKSGASHSHLGAQSEWLNKYARTTVVSKSVPSLSNLTQASKDTKDIAAASVRPKTEPSWENSAANLNSYGRGGVVSRDGLVPKAKSVDQLHKNIRTSKGLQKDLKFVIISKSGASFVSDLSRTHKMGSSGRDNIGRDGSSKASQSDLKNNPMRVADVKGPGDPHNTQHVDKRSKGSHGDEHSKEGRGGFTSGQKHDSPGEQKEDIKSAKIRDPGMNTKDQKRNIDPQTNSKDHKQIRDPSINPKVNTKTYDASTSVKDQTKNPRMNHKDQKRTIDPINDHKDQKRTIDPSNDPKVCGDQLYLRQCQIGSTTVFGLVQIKNDMHNSNGYPEGHGLVTIRMIPDEQGRFGFNVKGGADQGMPIIVSRVAPNTPADIAIPRLNEGDQVLYINGRDVSQHTHEQVVMFIRASRETHSGELVLIVRPNVYVGEDQPPGDPDPDLVYIPDSHQITGSLTGANALENSLMLLQESLDSGAALAQFEQLYRKKPGMTMNAARQDANVAKNRYRDISPYDQTRVILKGQTDYINANYVNMEIPGSGIVNRYIAAQGPLPSTCTDFWQMVWEQHTSLLVMLTMKNERGRVKCHQYWPEMYETLDYGALQITCVKEDASASFAFREFNLTNVETREERHISHMQYIAWPDHGVPDDPADFLDFVIKVRERRQGMVEPTVVHCSAGIGRTGVLITMETAMCLIEANQPVYPLSIVRQMRDQRAMLIQTASQYKFVCEAILKVFNEGIVKPEDYQR